MPGASELKATEDDARVRRILEVAGELLSDLDLDAVLARVIEAGRELSHSAYGAIGVLDSSRTQLERFITSGIGEDQRASIGELPTGRGVLGHLAAQNGPLRLRDIASHAASYGFPPEHPPMTSFIGVWVMVDGEPYGNLYLTDKAGGEPYTEDDEETVARLAQLAGLAIGHSRRLSGLSLSRDALRRTVDALEATMQIAHALGGETDLGNILQLVAQRGRSLVSARALVIEYLAGGRLTVAATAGEVPPQLVGNEVDPHGSVAGAAIETHKTLRVEDEQNRTRFERHGLGRFGLVPDAGLVVPLIFRGRAHGVLIALDRLEHGPAFDAEDQLLLESFAASAATAIATAETFAAERRRQRLAATEQERVRWARELHDETLQGLAAVKLGLAAGLRTGDQEALRASVTESVTQLEREISSLRSLIADLRPAALDELGLAAAVGDLAARARRQGLTVEVKLDLAHEGGRRRSRLTKQLEIAIYRIAQEALTNAHKHAAARSATVALQENETQIRLEVSDDGEGFEPSACTNGFGLTGMRERADLLGGTLTVRSAPGLGTSIEARLPVERRAGGIGGIGG